MTYERLDAQLVGVCLAHADLCGVGIEDLHVVGSNKLLEGETDGLQGGTVVLTLHLGGDTIVHKLIIFTACGETECENTCGKSAHEHLLYQILFCCHNFLNF